MGAILFWAVVAIVVLGAAALDRRHRRRVRAEVERASVVPPNLEDVRRDGLDNPIAAEGVFRIPPPRGF